jgi:hypothetical protein
MPQQPKPVLQHRQSPPTMPPKKVCNLKLFTFDDSLSIQVETQSAVNFLANPSLTLFALYTSQQRNYQ